MATINETWLRLWINPQRLYCDTFFWSGPSDGEGPGFAIKNWFLRCIQQPTVVASCLTTMGWH